MRDPNPTIIDPEIDSGVTMSALTDENPKATHVSCSSRQAPKAGGSAKAAYGWWITTSDMKPFRGGNSTLASSVQGWQAVALLQAMLEAVPNVPAWRHRHLVLELKEPFTDLLNEDPSVRRSRNYQKTNRKPLANEREWRALDALFDQINLAVCAGAPMTALGTAMFDYLAKLVREREGQISTTLMNGRNGADCLLHG